jgi:DNA adenine methylase
MSNIEIIKEITIPKQKLKQQERNLKLQDIKLHKPFLKWVGGKSQIIDDIIKLVPAQMNNYHEIFLGGGSVLFAILTLQKEGLINIKKDIYASDSNPTLINVYKHVQKNPKELYKYINKYINEYDSLEGDKINRNPKNKKEAKTSKESYYYWVRQLFNDDDFDDEVERSAVFMFLNKTCFRGIYREGPNGFNVPYGHYKKTPTIITKDELYTVNKLIQNVIFQCCDFEQSINKVKRKDFVYLDPPYAPETKTSFVKYTQDGFNLDTHQKLFKMIFDLDQNHGNVKILLSNADVEIVSIYFDTFYIQKIKVRRAINSKKPQSTTTEVLIRNYK